MANQIINSNNLTSKEIPELYVRYFNPKIKINTEITIPYYVSDNTQAEYLNNSNAKSFTTVVTFNSKTFSSTTTAGEFTINIGSVSTVGETYFSIYTIDGNGVASVEQFFDILIIDGAYPITQDQTYTMTSSDLNTYNIKAGESVSTSDAKINGASLTNLFKGIKDKGYRKIIMLNNTYMIDYHGDKVTLPDQFTVDMNGATFKATQCTDINVANILDLKDCFDSHVMNGKLVGNYDGFDFEATKNNTNYYIPGEGLAVAEINGARYSSFENMDMSYAVGYNLGVFGGKRSGYVGTPGKLAFKNQYYIDANGNQISSSDMCTTDITDISVLSDRGEFQCSVYLGYGGLALNKAELFIHFYDSSQKYLKTTKTRQYQIVKIPAGAKYVRVTGFTPVTESSGMTICHTGQATNCELINIKSHNTRTCAMHPGIYNHLLIKDCTFNKVADENEYKVTKLALDFEDGYENGRNLFFINNEVYDGTSALTIQKCFNCNVIKCRNFGLDLRGHIKGALIKNNFFNEGSIYTTNFDSQSHMKLDNNTFFRSLKFLKWDNNGNYPTVGLTHLDCKQNYQNNSNTNVIIDNAVDGSGSGGAPSQTYYNIINNISNCTTNNSDNLVLKDSSYKATITPKSGYDITSITVTMGGVDITSTALSGHTINIPKVTGNVNINVITREIENYRITNKLTNCTNSNSASSVLKNASYSGTIVSNEGYNLYSLIVTMDEADITSSSVSGNSINIPKVTGDVIITAVCTTEVSDIIYDNGALNKGTLKLKNATAESDYIRINQNQESSVTINDYKLTLNKNDKVYMDIGLDTSDPGSGYSIRIPQLGDSSVNNFTDTNMINESQIYNALNGKDKVTIYWTLANTVTDIDLTLTSYFARIKIFKIWIDKNSTESGGGGTTPETYYKITNNISHCTNSNSATSALKDSSYKATITPKGGYNITSITVTMGGTDITSTVLSGHVINIPKVTGDVIITAECTATEVSDNVIYDNGTMNKGTLKLNNATAESTYIRINQSQESSVMISGYPISLNKNDKVYMDIGLDTSDPSAGYSIRMFQLGDSSVNNFTDTNMINESQISTALNGKDKVTIYWTVANAISNIDLTLTSYFARVKIFKIWIDKTESGGGGGTTPETLTISNIPNMTKTAQTEFDIDYSTNIAVTKHEVSWDGGNTFYDKTSDVTANGTSYKFKHDNSGAVGTYNMAIRVTTSSGQSATSNIFTVTLTANATDEYSVSCTSDYILDKIYPMPQNHEALPSGVTDTWGTQSRWENQQRPTALAHNCGQANCPGAVQFKALGAWANVYRVKNSGFSTNTGVEMRNIKVYGWYNGQWEKVQDLAVPNGNFYTESFSGDSNQYFSDSIKTTSTSKTIILREVNKINGENCMYHPFSNIKNFDVKYEYVYTCIDLRKVKWDENGVDDRDSSHYCANCGGDWWLAEGLTFDSSWQHNKGICQPKIIEITNNWRRFSMTTVPQGWTNGFPQ